MSCPYPCKHGKFAAEMQCEKAGKRHQVVSFVPHRMAGATRSAAELRHFPRLQARNPPPVANVAIFFLECGKPPHWCEVLRKTKASTKVETNSLVVSCWLLVEEGWILTAADCRADNFAADCVRTGVFFRHVSGWICPRT
jgi:hypothetical protein